MSQVNKPLLELFRGHGVEADLQGEWLVFPGRHARAMALVFGEKEWNPDRAIQLDVRLEFEPGRTVVESCAGTGETLEKAIANAFQSFAVYSFHVLLAAFLGSDCSHVEREEWVIGGRTSQVTIGNVAIKGKPPGQGPEAVAWFHHFAKRIQAQELRPGTHWIRLYYGQHRNKPLALEVMLDNLHWEELQVEMAGYDWPSGEAFYSVRIFLVVQVGTGGLVSPETAVAWLANLVADWYDFTEDQVHAALVEAGVPELLAHRAYAFTQAAWGRAYLAGRGIQFSPEYACLNAAGQIVESGRLEDEPCFAAASRLAERYADTLGFKEIALMSSEVNVVNRAQDQGLKPENLTLLQIFVQLEPLTEEGARNAQRVMEQHLAPRRAPSAPKARPWWRFWN